jgi:hypothetical protein
LKANNQAGGAGINHKIMALWQVGYFIVPSDALEFMGTFNETNHHAFDDSVFWANSKMTPNEFSSIGSILPIGDSWSDDITLYGDEESHRVQVHVQAGKIQSVTARIDFTRPYEQVLEGLIEFLIHKGLILLDENLQSISLNIETIRANINLSPQVAKYFSMLNHDLPSS